MKRRNFSNTVIAIANQILRLAAVLAVTAYLARKLPPSDFGLISIVTVMSNFAMLICNMGFSSYTIQKKDADNGDYSTGFFLNTLLGLSVSLVIYLSAPLLSSWWDDTRLEDVLQVAAIALLFGAMGLQSKSLLEKSLRFKTLLYVELSSILLSVVVSLTVLAMGGGYWSLVALTFSRTTFLAISYMFSAGWLPSFSVTRAKIRDSLAFGVKVGLHNWLNFFARNVDKVLIGHYYGATSLGFYENAYKFMLFPVSNLRQPVNRVLLPSLSSANSEEDFRVQYTETHRFLCLLVVPGMLFLAVNAEMVIGLLLGDGWSETAKIFSVLSLVGLIQPLVTSTGVIMLARGDSKKYLKWGGAYAIGSILFIVGGLYYGALGVAVSYAIFNWLTAYWFVNYSCQGTSVGQSDFWRPVIKAVSLCMPAVLVTLVLQQSLEGMYLMSSITLLWLCSFALLVVLDNEYKKKVFSLVRRFR